MTEVEIENNWPQTLLLPTPRGFCAGVRRAIGALKETQNKNQDRTVYAYHEIIHNTHVVKSFEETGTKFVNEINEIPVGETVVLSAHGVSPEIRDQVEQRRLNWVDATCPLVEKTHREVKRFIEENYTTIYIGHRGHDETIGTLGEAPDKIKLIQNLEDATAVEVSDPEKVALITQTTLSQDETAEIVRVLKAKFNSLVEPKQEDICYATQNRQDGVKEIIKKGAKVIVVVGSPNSSNSQRLKEVAESLGAKGYLVDDVSELDPSIFFGVNCAGLTAGASAPDEKFQEVVDWFRARGSNIIKEVAVADENRINFAPPIQLRK